MKPDLPVGEVADLLGELFSEPPAGLARLPEGLESQAFRFEVGVDAFVVRIAASVRGFEKDRWAADVAGRHVPVPVVNAIGALDNAHYCVTQLLHGVTLEDLAPGEAARLVYEVEAAWAALEATDVESIAGFGDFDASGDAPAHSWRDVLLTTLESTEPTDDERVLEAYARLVDRCPEERSLVHADFGSNNILVHEGAVSGVLDWEHALVGDPLYDVANTRFWATHLPCMELQAAHFDRTQSGLPAYEDRVLCYALRIGIEEARSAARDVDSQMAAWATARCRELIAVTTRA